MKYISTYEEAKQQDGTIIAIALKGKAVDETTGVGSAFIYILTPEELSEAIKTPETIKELLTLKLAEAHIECEKKLEEVKPITTVYTTGDEKFDTIKPTEEAIALKVEEIKNG